MARKARQRISYVLPLANSAGGHRLGVNGLAVDPDLSVLYSGGRDGVICAWDLHLDLHRAVPADHDAKPLVAPATTFRQQVQAHTHWINDVALAHSNQALVSASSDVTVKLWRPAASDGLPPQTLGHHSDYVKTLAVPYATCDWVASGGLDRMINIWDLNGHGQRLSIDVGADEAASMLSKEKGSVYALAATNSLIASGGPESTVRVWDCRTGKRVTKLVGHTDNIRDVLVSQDGSTIMTASSDRTVKVWSTIAGRCMYTFTMHDASVWSLFSSHPDLSVFYSSDKNGLVAKTDTRNCLELDEGLSVAVCQEHQSVHRVISAGDSIWTATSRPSINRWRDVNTENLEIDVPENFNTHRLSSTTAKSRYPGSPNQQELSTSPPRSATGKRLIPLKHMLRLSSTAYFPTALIEASESNGSRRGTLNSLMTEATTLQPVRAQPEHAVEGQNGLIKHVMLNDRKRILTLDTAGEVVMWDLLKCVPIRSYGKRDLEDVKKEAATTAAVGNWCTVDIRTGRVAVILEDNTCFDAEMYADELDLDEDIEFKEDQRINLGKWVLRYLFDNLITEEIKRDEVFRQRLLGTRNQPKFQRENAPSNIQIPDAHVKAWHNDAPTSATTPRANGIFKSTATPGLNIGLATPQPHHSPLLSRASPKLAPTNEEKVPLEHRISQQMQRLSSDRPVDYFSTTRPPVTEITTPTGTSQPAATPNEPPEPQTPAAEDASKDSAPGKEGLFGKKFRMNMSFSGMKKIGRTQTNDKPAPVEEKEETETDSHSSKTSNSRVIDDNFAGTIQKIHFAYEDSLSQQLQSRQAQENGLPVSSTPLDLPTGITPSLPAETPVLKPPPNTIVLIQEERPEAGGVADLFEGTVGALGGMADLVEKTAPMWLGEVLLRNLSPQKDMAKVSFVLEPWQNSLPSIASDGNNRLNANRMLRARKILSYVAERIEPRDPNVAETMKAEEYLELWCQNQLVPSSMTLMTIRSHLWRGSGDVVLYYKSNGKKPIAHTRPPQSQTGSGAGRSTTTAGAGADAAS